MRERSSGEWIHGVHTLKEIPNTHLHLNVGIFMFYVDAATVIEFGTRYNIVFKKRILLYYYHLYTGTGLMIWVQ